MVISSGYITRGHICALEVACSPLILGLATNCFSLSNVSVTKVSCSTVEYGCVNVFVYHLKMNVDVISS